MAHVNREAQDLIKESGGKLIRKTKHGFLYRLPGGARIGFSSSPGDFRAIRSLRSELKRKTSA